MHVEIVVQYFKGDPRSGSSISYLYEGYGTFQVVMMFNDVGKLGSQLGGYNIWWNREQLEGVLLVQALFSKMNLLKIVCLLSMV
jgi:hypothetical protein